MEWTKNTIKIYSTIYKIETPCEVLQGHNLAVHRTIGSKRDEYTVSIFSHGVALAKHLKKLPKIKDYLIKLVTESPELVPLLNSTSLIDSILKGDRPEEMDKIYNISEALNLNLHEH